MESMTFCSSRVFLQKALPKTLYSLVLDKRESVPCDARSPILTMRIFMNIHLARKTSQILKGSCASSDGEDV